MKSINIAKGAPFSASLNRFVKDEYCRLITEGHSFSFVPGQPYDDFEQMKQDYIQTGRILISTDYCDNTIFGDKNINLMFRAVHDMQHIRLNKDFSHASEYYITYQMVKEYRAKGLSQFDIDLLTIEMNGQIGYHLDNNGAFPDNQRDFTISELRQLGYNVIEEYAALECRCKNDIAAAVLLGIPSITYNNKPVQLPEPQTRGTEHQKSIYANMVADVVYRTGKYYNN